MNWWKGLGSRVRLNEPLKSKTTFKVGGEASFFCEPKDAGELRLLIISAKKYNVPVFVMGSGSNILVDDRGVNGLVLKLSSVFFKRIAVKRSYLEAGSGVMLVKLIQTALNNNLSGLESLSGIPGTLGGALSMNAGAAGISIGDLVQRVKVMDYKGNIRILQSEDIKFGYRKTNLGKYIILSGLLRLARKDKEEIKNNIRKYLEYRRKTQDVTSPNAGCIFKNPKGDFAGRLIESCGLKGARQGGACVSLRHANFILNQNSASADDVLKLMDMIKKKVRHVFGIELEAEVKIWR